MSLACIICPAMDTSREFARSQSTRSDIEVSCCWATTRKTPQQPPQHRHNHHNHNHHHLAPLPNGDSNSGSKVAPAPSRNASLTSDDTPRLLRCHAVRRDLFNDWNFEEFMAGLAWLPTMVYVLTLLNVFAWLFLRWYGLCSTVFFGYAWSLLEPFLQFPSCYTLWCSDTSFFFWGGGCREGENLTF